MLKEARLFSMFQSGGANLVMLEEIDGNQLIPIWIGKSESGSLGAALMGRETPRPLTHDLFNTTLTLLNAAIQSVAITRIENETYFAEIHLVQGIKEFTIDARPSDALALAARVHCPIFIDSEILNKIPKLHRMDLQKKMVPVRSKLSKIDATEFINKLHVKENFE